MTFPKYPILLLLTAFTLLLGSCSPSLDDAQQVNTLPHLYPDYTDVTIPRNIAPLNFMLRDSSEAVAVKINGELFTYNSDNKIIFDISDWKKLLQDNAGKQIDVKVFAKYGDQWKAYRSFHWDVANDTIDPYLTYRLIEPDYEIWNNVQIQQRNITNFDTKPLSHYDLQENRCMNCHIPGNQNPNLSMLYVRGKEGGAILNENGKLRKLDIKAKNDVDSMLTSSVYYGFDPTGRYITFSTNLIIPAFHSAKSKRLEVYDSKSDVYACLV